MKKFTSILVVAAMLATMLVTMIPTASAAWDGSSASAALVGSGTELDPYLISSENDLAFVAKQVNDAVTTYAGEYFKLTVDLDLGGHNWSPIGQVKANYFSGIFDGDGHTITGLTVKTNPDDANALYGGVFGRVYDGVIKNLNVDGANVVAYKYGGAIAGLLNCTKEGGYAAIINCHATNCEIRGLQIGGIVGRSSQSGAPKGAFEIIGCTADNITLNPVTADDFAALTLDNGNHFVGGIVGAAGSTVITGCAATNITATVYGTSFAPVGGIVGVLGADKASSDVTNCYVIGVNFTALDGCHAEKTAIGGLIGKAAHVTVVVGDANTEYNIYNNYVADVTITNTASVANGVVVGWVNDTILFNDVYYVPVSGLESFGTDSYWAEWPFMTVSAVAEINATMLNTGNSTTVWVDDLVVGHPVIDVDAAIANEPTYIDYYVENAPETSEPEQTTEEPEVTTEEPEVTTEEPEQTTEELEVTTETPTPADPGSDNTEPTATEPVKEGGCGGMIAGGVVIVALLGTAVVFKKRD